MEFLISYWKTVLLLTVAAGVVLLVSRNIRKAAAVAAGYGIYAVFGELYDTVLWPVVQGAFGSKGAVGMSLGAIGINFVVLSVYQRQKVDWLGISVIDTLMSRSAETANRFLAHPTWRGAFLFIPARMLHSLGWMLRTPWSAFIVLSTFGDSFLTTAFLRQARFGPLNRRDILIFLASSIVSCGVWIIWNAGVVKLFRQLWSSFI